MRPTLTLRPEADPCRPPKFQGFSSLDHSILELQSSAPVTPLWQADLDFWRQYACREQEVPGSLCPPGWTTANESWVWTFESPDVLNQVKTALRHKWHSQSLCRARLRPPPTGRYLHQVFLISVWLPSACLYSPGNIFLINCLHNNPHLRVCSWGDWPKTSCCTDFIYLFLLR